MSCCLRRSACIGCIDAQIRLRIGNARQNEAILSFLRAQPGPLDTVAYAPVVQPANAGAASTVSARTGQANARQLC